MNKDALKSLRQSLGLTQAQMAKRIKLPVSLRTYHRWEADGSPAEYDETVMALAPKKNTKRPPPKSTRDSPKSKAL